MFSFNKEKSPVDTLENPGNQRVGVIARLKAGLSKTRHGLTEGIANLVLGRKQIDEELLEDLETQLLLADVGVAATQDIIRDLTGRVARKELSDADALMSALQEDMKAILRDMKNTEAVENQPLFQGWTDESEEVEQARELLADWDCNMFKQSAAAALYWTWKNEVDGDGLTEASGEVQVALVRSALAEAVESMKQTQGTDWSEWRWGRIQRSEFAGGFADGLDD